MSGARERAERDQLAASDPLVSAFVSASAGSGKTKLLTDRLLRLMLKGENPARIQCLTFTKAAAAEMSLRLQSMLAQWVTLDDGALDKALARLDCEPSGELRSTARALFARVLDLPGGMRIGTIHAFCQSLLRRFPLEAELSPHFQLVSDADAVAALIQSREAMLAGVQSPADLSALSLLAGLASLDQFGRLVTILQADRDRLDEVVALQSSGWTQAQRRVLGVTAADEAGIIAAAIHWGAEESFRRALLRVQTEGSRTVAETAAALLEWLSLDDETRCEHWEAWSEKFLRDDGERRGFGKILNPKLAADPLLAAVFKQEQDRVHGVLDARRALKVAKISAALLDLAAPVAAGYAGHKSDAGLMDYSDLIIRTARLLVDPGAAWVLFKLDGGLDHLLLDEVQDTSAGQWAIAHALTAEFFAGAGAREDSRPRTVFAVGDNKQSIYSFQGADPVVFEKSRRRLRQLVQDAQQTWRETPLNVSFRSTVPVLRLVDAVFADGLAATGVCEPGALRHETDRQGHAGRVELWPLEPVPPSEPPAPWRVAEKNHAGKSAPQNLADRLADWIANQTDGSVMLESRGRRLAAGDVLVLVRRRTDFSRALVRALKARGVKVAGLDRMVLTAQPAVADLLALCDTLLLLDDDLSLACVLTSPLGGLDDQSLMELAVHRRGSLWEQLRARHRERVEWAAAWRMLSALLARVDFVTPYALLAEALGQFGGRAALLARLGPEAAEPIDELLAAALAYGNDHVPSLQGFVHWLRQSGAEVKREAEGAGDAVRVMTVHGAKGLQAPLVIVPDTTALPPDDGPLLWAADGVSGVSVPIWAPRRELRCGLSDRLRKDVEDRRLAEHNRLLYVALTRAEDRLVVCGWETRRKLSESCWYELVRRGFGGLDDVQLEDAVQFVACPQERDPTMAAGRTVASDIAELPEWAGRAPAWRGLPPAAEAAPPQPLAPSRSVAAPIGAAAAPLAQREAAGARFKFGVLLHALLQHLPTLPAAERRAAMQRFIDRPGHAMSAAQIALLAAETVGILEHPDLSPVFGPSSQAEVPLTGMVGGSVVGGLVDRLVVGEDRVLVVDFKTNRAVPAGAEETPVLYLRQMAAYRAVLRQIFPGRRVSCALIWTREAKISWLDDTVLNRHAPIEPS
jgi:ATP-dependent helicase/nuclease subunit A